MHRSDLGAQTVAAEFPVRMECRMSGVVDGRVFVSGPARLAD
jgi:hypothetical protein